MSELKKCSRCRSEILLTYFAINRKGEYNKTCETCLNKTKAKDLRAFRYGYEQSGHC